MPARFSHSEIAFDYPDNWTLENEDTQAECHSVTVYSPGGAFWAVSAHPHSTIPDELATAAVEAMKEEYKELEVEETWDDIAGQEIRGYDMNFHYLDLTNTAQVRCWQTNRTTYTIFCQAEDREFDRVQPVFQAMVVSLMNQIG